MSNHVQHVIYHDQAKRLEYYKPPASRKSRRLSQDTRNHIFVLIAALMGLLLAVAVG